MLDAPVLTVEIDNAPRARPAKGLDAADLVYVEPVERGVSRIIAVFASRLPRVVGPVRSARETDLQLLPQFGNPALAVSGAAPALLSRIAGSPMRDVSAARVPGAYFREKGRAAPHNMFLRPRRLPRGATWPASSRPQFGPPPEGGVPNGHEMVRYRAASVAFDWSAAQNRWLVSLDGAPAMSDNHRLQAARHPSPKPSGRARHGCCATGSRSRPPDLERHPSRPPPTAPPAANPCDSNPARSGPDSGRRRPSRKRPSRKGTGLLAALPTMVASDIRRRRGPEPIAPDSQLGCTENMLYVSFGEVPAPTIVHAFEVAVVLYADHRFSASTLDTRVATSTLSDLRRITLASYRSLSGGAPAVVTHAVGHHLHPQ